MNKKQLNILGQMKAGFKLGRYGIRWVLFRESKIPGRFPKREHDYVSVKDCELMLSSGKIKRSGTFRGPEGHVYEQFVVMPEAPTEKTRKTKANADLRPSV